MYYANILVDYTGDILFPATRWSTRWRLCRFRDIGAELVLDMGESEKCTGDLTLYFEMFDATALASSSPSVMPRAERFSSALRF